MGSGGTRGGRTGQQCTPRHRAIPWRALAREITANLPTALVICLGWLLVVIALGPMIGPHGRGSPPQAEGCLLIAPSPGMVDLNRPFDYTAHLNSTTCDLRSALSKQPLRLQDLPPGRLIDLDLTSRKELSIRERGTSARALPTNRTASWTWELRPTVATSYELALVVTVYDPDTDEIIDESEPLYICFDAVPSNLRIVATSWNSLGTIPGAIAALVAALAITGPLWLRIPTRNPTPPAALDP